MTDLNTHSVFLINSYLLQQSIDHKPKQTFSKNLKRFEFCHFIFLTWFLNSFASKNILKNLRTQMPESYPTSPTVLTHTKLFKYDCQQTSICNPYFVLLKPGVYKFECWGASGGNHSNDGVHGNGAYVSGIIRFPYFKQLFLYVGGSGSYTEGGYNGGGFANIQASGGGGASDIRLFGGNWNDSLSLASRIIVAGAGGGSNNFINGGDAGALIGYDGGKASDRGGCGELIFATGGTQEKGGTGLISGGFGKGGSQTAEEGDIDGGAGGSGYFGGGKAGGCELSGAGGSSFVSGYQGCLAINEPSADGSFTMSTKSVHYSGLFFHNPIMQDGKTSFYSPEGIIETGHIGHGAIKITIFSTILTCKSNIRIPHFLISIYLISSE